MLSNKMGIITALALLIAAYYGYANAGGETADVGKFVFLKVDLDEDVFPYVVVGRDIAPAPLVWVYINKTVYSPEEGINITAQVPVGRFLAVPRHAFNNFTRSHPRAVDLEVEGLGKVRLVLPRNTTELGPPREVDTPRGKALEVASRVELWVVAEERDGKLYLGGKPLDIRTPKNQPPKKQPPKNPKSLGQSDAGTLDLSSDSTTVTRYANYLFAPVVHANVVDSIYTAARFWIAYGFDIENRRYKFYGKDDPKSKYAYLGYGVLRVYVHVSWRPGDPEPGPGAWLLIRYGTDPSQLTSSTWFYVSPQGYKFDNVKRKLYIFDVTSYSSYYIQVYTDIYYYSMPLNISIMAVYKRPADYSAYGLLKANWQWDLVQPGSRLYIQLPSIYSTTSLLFIARIAPGAQGDAWLGISSFIVKTCSNTDVQRVTIYLGGEPVVTLTSSTYSVTWDGCREFSFTGATAWVNLEKAAMWWYSVNASTYLPLYLVFDPPIQRGWPPAEIRDLRISLWGWRWPEIWRENSATWVSNKLLFSDFYNQYNYFKEEPKYRSEHVRDIFMHTVWDYLLVNDETLDTVGRYRLAYADIRMSSYIIAGDLQARARGRVTYSYLKWHRDLKLYRVCMGIPRIGDDATLGMRIQGAVNYPEQLIAATSTATYVAGTIITFLSVFSTNPWLIAGSIVVWGIDSLLRVAEPPSTVSCSPGPDYASIGYDTQGYGNIEFAHIRFTDLLTPQTGGVAMTERLLYYEARYSYGAPPKGYYNALTFLRVDYRDVGRIFNGPEEPYAFAWSGFLVEFN